MSEWKRPYVFYRGHVWQKTYGVKVGHVVKRGWGKAARWVALFDGKMVGVFEAEDAARAAVDMQGTIWEAKS